MITKKATVICPHCKYEISLDDALTHNIQSQLQQDFEIKLQKEKVAMWKIAQEKAEIKFKTEQETEIKLLKDELDEKAKKLENAQKTELDLRKKRAQLEEDKKLFELTLTRKLDDERAKIREDTARQIFEKNQLKQAEMEKQLQDARKANEELRRKLEQGSQQTQGEVLELKLEGLLKSEFPLDEIKPVSKGIHGADIIQVVYDRSGRICGSIIWESKSTKSWSETWISKLKDDQRLAKAEMAILVTNVLPAGTKNFDLKENIYITNYESVLGVAKYLRTAIIQITLTKQISTGKGEKMEVLWNYLTSTEFKQRMEILLDSFIGQKSDLEKEKRIFMKLWAKREKQIQRVIDNAVGMHGDLAGLMGTALPEIKSLELNDSELDSEFSLE